jgi:hypothetical protein
MATLVTSNLPVKTILQTLGVSSARAIFYKGTGLTTLKTAAELGALVRAGGLSSYCPGATAEAKLGNLLADRKLSYFKGYNHDSFNYFETNNSSRGIVSITFSGKPSTVPGTFSSVPAQSISVTFMEVSDGNYVLSLLVNGAIMESKPINYKSLSATLTLASTVTYPSTLEIKLENA